MRPPPAALLAAALAALAAAVLGLAEPQPAAAATTAAPKLERNVVVRVNAARTARGLKPLRAAPRLQKAGRGHALDMARHGYFAHEWSNGAPFSRWIRRYWPGPGHRSWSAGENLYWEGPSTNARRVVRAWLRSPPHRKNLLSPSWRRLGVGAVKTTTPKGVYRGAGTATIVAAEFGSRSR